MTNFRQDIRYALRTLARAPGFAAIAVLTLALGIGANTAIFSLVHAVILKPLPYRDPGKLVVVWDTYLPQYPRLGVSPPELAAWQQQTDLFEETAWYRYVSQNLTLMAPGAEALEIHATVASPALFPLLGVTPAAGHLFTAGDGPHAALLGHALWRTRFGTDLSIAGRAIRLNDQEFVIAGVLPADFQFPEGADLWLPPGPLMGDEMTNPVRHSMGFVGRLRPGATVAQAGSRLDTIARRLATEHPKTSTGFAMKLVGLQDDLTASVRPTLLLLLGAVTLVLLIACSNIANLLLSRATGRAREVALRIALGAGSLRIVSQLFTESVVLALVGGAIGLALAAWGLAVAPVKAPLDATVLLFLVIVSTLTGVVAGLAPALQTLRSDTNAVIKSASASGGGSATLRGALVVCEIALAMVLVISAGVLTKSFLRLLNVDPGFDPHGVLTLRLSVPPSRNTAVLFHRMESRLRQLPGVDAVAVTNNLPLIGSRSAATRFHVPGSPLINPDALPSAQLRAVSPEYFRALRIPLRSGRTFTERDLNDNVVIINEAMARRFWPGSDPVGMKFVTGPWGPNPTYSTIIGVAGDVKNFGLDSEATMDLYFPSLAPRFVIVHTAGDPASLAGAFRSAVQAADASLPISDLRTMDEILTESASTRRWTMALLALFAGLALVLALVGVYGVMSWSVEQRTREIGIRMALGADRLQVLGLVIRSGLKLSMAGLAIGLGSAFALRQVLAGLVFGVSPADPMTYAAVSLIMLMVALLACYVPARRAARVDPQVALRGE